MIRATFSVLLFAACFRSSEAQQPPARSTADVAPTPRYSPGVAFDEKRQRLVMFGGYIRGTYPGETWEWDGSHWTKAGETGPDGRNFPVMVFDASRGKVVLFGGDTRLSGALGDTWEWDGRIWSKVSGEGPPPRSLHGMAYDANRRKTVLFGGRDGEKFLTDTWELALGGWKKVADTGPPPRMMPAMAYHQQEKKVMVVGGNRAAGTPTAADVLGDVWAWDGVIWKEIPGGPSPRDHSAATFNPIGGGVMVIGGSAPTGEAVADGWTFAGGRWVSLATGELGARAGHRLSTDQRNRRVFLYGGFAGNTAAGDLWEYTVTGWRRVW
jgi:hypothetical protein